MAKRSSRWAWLGACALAGCASGAAGDRAAARPEATAASASGVPAPGLTTSGAPAPERAAPREGESGTVEGRVEIDRGNRLMVAGSEDEGLAFEQFRIDDRTEVTIDGQKASVAQVNAGDEVRASYSGTPEALHVDRLEVVSGEGGPRDGPQR